MFEMFKATISKFKNSDENLKNEEIKNEEIKALNSIVALLVEAASIDGNIGLDEKNQIKTILTDPIVIKKCVFLIIFVSTFIFPEIIALEAKCLVLKILTCQSH